MKRSELRTIIKEEVQKVLGEVKVEQDFRFESTDELNEVNFTKLPPKIEDLTITHLHTGMNRAVLKLLDDIKSRTGSNANPISLQVLGGWTDISNKMMKGGPKKGREAMDFFLSLALKEFQTDFPFIRTLAKKYGLKEGTYFTDGGWR